MNPLIEAIHGPIYFLFTFADQLLGSVRTCGYGDHNRLRARG